MHAKVGASPARGGDAARTGNAPPESVEMLHSLYREERVYLLRIIRSGPHCRAGTEEDILQEAVERLLAKAGGASMSWESLNHCRNSLLMTARNLAVDHCRREARRHRTFLYHAELAPRRDGGEDGDLEPDYEECAAGTSSEENPEESVLRAEECAHAREVLAALGREERHLLLMREELLLPWEEIASATGIRADALRVRYSRLKAGLRRALRERYICRGS